MTMMRMIDLIVNIGKTFLKILEIFLYVTLGLGGLVAITCGIAVAGIFLGPVGAILATALGLAIIVEVTKAILDTLNL